MQAFQKISATPRGKAALGAVAVALVLAIIGSIYWFGGSTKASNGPVTAPTLVATKDGKIFTIDQSSTTASFTINEVLFGNPNTVVGKTNQVAGQILVDTKTPSASQVGEIKVDLSTLVTDNDFRNRALQGRILATGDVSNQYAVFVATSLSGLPAAITTGQPVTFQINGNLTLHGVTRPATFQTTVTLTDSATLQGQATTTVKYSDFNIAIPNVPSVSGVGDTVQLALDFTAKG